MQGGGIKNTNPEVCLAAGTTGYYVAKVSIFLLSSNFFARKTHFLSLFLLFPKSFVFLQTENHHDVIHKSLK